MRKIIQGRVFRTTEQPWGEATVIFSRLPGSYTAAGQFPSDQAQVETDALGNFSIELWVDGEGLIPTRYRCDLPNRDFFLFEIDATDPSPVEISVLRSRYLAAHPSAPVPPDAPLLYAPIVHAHPEYAGGAPYIHTQGTAAATWTVNHGLGTRRSPSLYNLAWEPIVGAVSQPTDLQAVVEFVSPLTGYLILS